MTALGTAIGLLLLSLGTDCIAQTNVTPAQYLASQQPPNFAVGTQLPMLTRWGWCLASNACVALATNWDYALPLDNYTTPATVSNVITPGTFDYGMVQLAENNPTVFKLSVTADRTFPAPIPNGFYCTNSSGQILTNGINVPAVSPEGPDSYWQYATAYWMSNLLVINSNAPIAIVLNGGEYGLDVAGFGMAAWVQDPRVQAATNAPAYTNMGSSMSRYASNRKAHQLGFLTAAIEKQLPNCQLNIFYNTGNEQNMYATYYTNWFNKDDAWGWNSDVMATNTSLPSFEDYFSTPPGWLSQTNPFPNDILTRHLDAVGYNIGLGHPLNYSWLNGGSGTNNSGTNYSDIPHYMGFLKCLYTGGMVGGIAGFFNYPQGGFDVSFSTNNPPQWLLQIMALSQVHALFSHFDNFLYKGQLLSGPQPNSMSNDQPAYEFTNTLADATVRVLARKLNNTNLWLITAWDSAGSNEIVTVSIPTLGSVSVLARDCGSVYQATTTNLTLIDVNGMLPTASLGIPAAPTDLHVVFSSTN